MSTPRKLSDGTQIIPMLEITEARCRCERRLTWKATDESEGDAYVNYAECKCGIWLISSDSLKDYNPRPRGRPQSEYRHALPTNVQQSVLARRLGISRQRVHQLLNKESLWARRAVALALKDGRLTKPENCERCGEQKRLEAHHSDYSKRLDVLWLCAPCHSLVHPHHSNINGKMDNLPYGHGKPLKTGSKNGRASRPRKAKS